MKQNIVGLTLVLLTIFLTSGFVLAQLGIPHQFYGTVTYNGAPAPDGLNVEAKIDGVTVKETTTLSGQYGYDPLFFITDPGEAREGKRIIFYVNNVEAASSIFGNGKVSELNLAVNGPAIGGGGSGSDSSGGSSGGGGGGGSSGGGGGSGRGSTSGGSTTTIPGLTTLTDTGAQETENNIEELGSSKITGAVTGSVGSIIMGMFIFAFIIIVLVIGVVLITKKKSKS